MSNRYLQYISLHTQSVHFHDTWTIGPLPLTKLNQGYNNLISSSEIQTTNIGEALGIKNDIILL